MRVIQISDTHLSADHGHFSDNVLAVKRWLDATAADLVINTGDLTMNGAISDADMALARDWHVSLGRPVLSIPGNHDVGDRADINAAEALDDARLAKFRATIGPDRWVHDADGWRLIGLNAMLIGTDHPDEAAQLAWLEQVIAVPAKIAVFLHKPLFIDAPQEGPRGYWTVIPDRRLRLMQILAKADVRLLASGHLHIARAAMVDGVSHVWGPSAAFVCGPIQEDLGGERRIGAVIHDFDADGVTSQFVYPEGAEDRPIDPVIATIYPPAPRAT